METKRIDTFNTLLEEARKGEKGKIAVVSAENDDILLAIDEARKEGLADAHLIGNLGEIKKIASSCNIDITKYNCISCSSDYQAGFEALELVRTGEANLIMKGNINTSELLNILLHKEKGIRTGRLLSHVTIFELPDANGFRFLSDAAINVKPTCTDKIAICQNALFVANALGYIYPKIALITPFEKVFLKEIPSTVDAALIAKMGERGQIGEAYFDGPISIDIALSKEAAIEKEYNGLIQGDADIMIVHDIEAGNVFYKSLIYFTEAIVAGIVAGAKVPIILTSRSDSEKTKFMSIAAGVVLSRRWQMEDRSV